jgi:glycosyltransferase involved in cell wall biosynthesis
MKILLAHKFCYGRGGADVFFLETGKVLQERGHEIAYFSTIDERNLKVGSVTKFVNPPEYQDRSLLKRIRALPKIIYSRDAKAQFEQLLKSFAPDIVHAFHIYTHLSPSILDACRDAGVPVVMSLNDYKHICPNYKLYHSGSTCEDCKNGKFYWAALNRCCQNSLAFSIGSTIEAYVHAALDIYKKNIHTFLFASKFMANKTEEFWGKNTFRWSLLRNPFDISVITPCKEYDNYFLYFGRFSEEKGVHVLLEAMQFLKAVHLVLVGEGPQMLQLKALTLKYNLLNVEFVGPKWGKDLEGFLHKSRFVVVPSIWHENFPYVILQSFAAGKTVIGTDHGGIPELVRHGRFGLICPALNPSALAEAIRQLWNNPDAAVSMGLQAREYVEQEFSYTRYYEDLIKIYGKAIQ